MNVDSFAEEAARMASASEIDALFLEACAEEGHRHVMYGNFLHLDGFEGGVRLDSFPSEWRSIYARENLQGHDPALKGLLFSTGAFGWNDYIECEEENAMVSRAAGFGLTHGLIAPIRVARGEFYAASMAGAAAPSDQSQRARISYIANIYHINRVRFETVQERSAAKLRLSPTQAVCLRMVAEGYSIAAIASERATTSSAVEKCLRTARDQLGAANSTFAVAKAIAYGVIDPAVVRPWLQE